MQSIEEKKRKKGICQVILLFAGIPLYLFSAAMIPLRAWNLTPWTAGAVGAWCIGIAITTAQTVWENYWERVGGSVRRYALLGVLQLVAVARYASQVERTRAGAWV